MPRRPPPDQRDDPRRFAGLTQRRRERGLPTGEVDPDDPTQFCPDCHAPVVLAEASHFLKMPREAMAPAQAPRPVAATYTCANGHEWTRST